MLCAEPHHATAQNDTSADPAKDVVSLRTFSATEPADAAATIRAVDGFTLELLAAEPMVMDPVAMAYDENGRAYVVEMGDYPYMDAALDEAWAEQRSPPGGRVRLLTDDDGDGVFDRSTVFADELSWPTGVACWRGGIYVSATPDVWYLKDRDGDGVADVRRKVFAGFRKYNVQAVANNLKWGLDHHIYGAGASNGGTITRPGAEGDAARPPIRLGRNDFRFDPLTERLDVLSGGARFGNTFDDWGNRFICNLRNPVQHVVLAAEYLAANSWYVAPSAVADVAVAGDAVPVFRASPPEPWRVENARRLAADTSRTSPRSEQVATGYVTSASGITIYRGDAYAEEYYGNAFVAEVAGNLVMRYELTESGATFRAARPESGEEFLASTDNWFRPVNFCNAPDGTLTVLDMYRETIEHPWSIPDDLKARLDLRSGNDRGRLYRLVPGRYREGYVRPEAPRLGEATTEELVAAMGRSGSWWRETAARLLFERQDMSAVESLRTMAREHDDSRSRVAALWALEGLGAVKWEDVETALADDDAGMRVQGVKLAERFSSEEDDAARLVLRMAEDTAATVRFQAALTLGRINMEAPRDARTPVARAMASLAKRDVNDSWMRRAVIVSAVACPVELLNELAADRAICDSAEGREVLQGVAIVAGGTGQVRAVAEGLAGAVTEEAGWSIVLGLSKGASVTGEALLTAAATERDELEAVRGRALEVAVDRRETIVTRVAAIDAAHVLSSESHMTALLDLVQVEEPTEVQRAAVGGVIRVGGREGAEALLVRYATATPSIRAEIVDQVLARSDLVPALLDAIEAGKVSATAVPMVFQDRLKSDRDEMTRALAERLFRPVVREARKAVISRYAAALDEVADVARGEAVFRRECAACHRFSGGGYEVGPNLATIRNRTAEEILVHVLDPHREVSPNWQQYVVVTNDGVVKTGVIAAETASGITLRQAEGREETVARREIETLESTGKSLMPEGMEEKITTAEMRDLLAFLLGE